MTKRRRDHSIGPCEAARPGDRKSINVIYVFVFITIKHEAKGTTLRVTWLHGEIRRKRSTRGEPPGMVTHTRGTRVD